VVAVTTGQGVGDACRRESEVYGDDDDEMHRSRDSPSEEPEGIGWMKRDDVVFVRRWVADPGTAPEVGV